MGNANFISLCKPNCIETLHKSYLLLVGLYLGTSFSTGALYARIPYACRERAPVQQMHQRINQLFLCCRFVPVRIAPSRRQVVLKRGGMHLWDVVSLNLPSIAILYRMMCVAAGQCATAHTQRCYPSFRTIFLGDPSLRLLKMQASIALIKKGVKMIQSSIV